MKYFKFLLDPVEIRTQALTRWLYSTLTTRQPEGTPLERFMNQVNPSSDGSPPLSAKLLSTRCIPITAPTITSLNENTISPSL